MLIDHTKGVGLVGNPNPPVYNEEYDLPDLSKLDFTEIDQYRREVANRIEATKNQIKENRKNLSLAHAELSKREADKLKAPKVVEGPPQ